MPSLNFHSNKGNNMRKSLFIIISATLLLCMGMKVLAQTAAPAENQAEQVAVETAAPTQAVAPISGSAIEEENTVITLKDIFTKGGWIMYVIAALSFMAIALTIFYILTMRAALLFPEHFIVEASNYAESNDIDSLRTLCENNQNPASRILSASLEQIVPGKAVNMDRLKNAMEDEGSRQAGFLWQRLQYLMDIAVISPMVGLLGTVWGMMISFGGIENGAEFAKKAETLASGISQAMYTTFGGLIVGIFAMALYDILRGHLNRLVSSMESACNSVLMKLDQAQGEDK